ncbi:MAG: hypothetical protein B7Y61_23070 [Rhizobiales bacterium 35-66-30]|jgi:hypothetical protein|nr:MAG: hypothetical protein B7Y61_23070 [Rhizobiales bacterium 35-66-30]OZA91745.1 MAG: hypothetical protein B7X67_29910 [Rhizobiales bacterium 39-66-18]
MEPAKTISIVCPENVRAGYKNIPAAEFDPAVHVPFDIETGQPGLRHDGPTVAEYVAAGYLASNYPPLGYASRSTEEEIAAAVAAQTSGNGSNPVEIPADWQALHWKQRVALAEKLTRDGALVLADGQKPADAADAVIAAEVARRTEA